MQTSLTDEKTVQTSGRQNEEDEVERKMDAGERETVTGTDD